MVSEEPVSRSEAVIASGEDLFEAWDLNSVPSRFLFGVLVARVDVPDDAHSGVGPKHAGESAVGVVAAVRDDHHPGMERVADPDPAAVMEADPACPVDGVEQRHDQAADAPAQDHPRGGLDQPLLGRVIADLAILYLQPIIDHEA